MILTKENIHEFIGRATVFLSEAGYHFWSIYPYLAGKNIKYLGFFFGYHTTNGKTTKVVAAVEMGDTFKMLEDRIHQAKQDISFLNADQGYKISTSPRGYSEIMFDEFVTD